MDKRIVSMIGLCRRASLLVSGEYSCEKALQAGKAKLILVSQDASNNTKEKFMNKSAYYKVPICFCGSKEELGSAVGKEFRAVVIIMDINFSKKIQLLVEEEAKVGGADIAEGTSI